MGWSLLLFDFKNSFFDYLGGLRFIIKVNEQSKKVGEKEFISSMGRIYLDIVGYRDGV